MVAAPALGAGGAIRGGSSPLSSTLDFSRFFYILSYGFTNLGNSATAAYGGVVMFGNLSISSFILALAMTGLTLVIAVQIVMEMAKTDTARPPGMNNQLEPVELKKTLYWKTIFATLIGCATLVLFGASAWYVDLWSWGVIGFNLGFPLIAPVLLYLGISIQVVEKGYRGALYFYGIAIKNVGPGPHFVPRLLFTLVTQPVDVQTILEPGPRDKIFWKDEKDEKMPEGMVRPIFVNSRPPNIPLPGSTPEGVAAPDDAQMQYAVAYYMFWTVSDDVATFEQNTRSIAEADSQLREMSVSELSVILGERTAEGVIATMKNTNEEFKAAVCAKAVGMGVRITDVGLVNINQSHEMARVRRDRVAAKLKAEIQNIETDVEARRIREVGEAEGDAAYARSRGELEGRADGMADIKERIGVDGTAVLAHETIREGWPKTTVLAGASSGTSDLAGAMGTLAATYAAMNDKGEPRKDEEKQP